MKKWVMFQIIRLAVWLSLGAFAGFWAEWVWTRNISSSGILAGMLAVTLFLWLVKTLRAFSFAQWIARGANGERGRWATETGWARAADWIEKRIRASVRKAETEIRTHQQILAAMQSLPIGITLLDHLGRIEWVNDAALEHFKLDRIKDHLQHLGNLVRHPDLLELLNNHQFDKTLYLSYDPASGKLAIQITSYQDLLRKNQEHIMVLSRDISDLERTDQMRRDFVANVSHEMRTPLTVLSGFIETLQNLPLKDEERHHYLDLMAVQTSRMQSLISDLLFLAKLEGSPIPSFDSRVDVQRIFKQVADSARALSSGKHEIVFPERVTGSIAGIEQELVSAVTNLVSNAIRYTPEGGHIHVSWSVAENGDGIIAVQDDGPGISPENIPRLAERFYRPDKSRSRDTGGTGLGLSIVKHIQTRHNGTLAIDSHLGKGSTFRLTYPSKRITSNG